MIRVERIDLYQVSLPLVHEFETSSHRKGRIEHILVRLTDEDQRTGWGECASPSDPYYCGESVDTCWLMLSRYLAPALLGARWETPEDAARISSVVSGNRFARAGLDIACWDLWCRRREISLADALGGTAESIEAGVSLGIERSVGGLLEQVERHVAQGYSRVKLKIRPGWDVEPARAVREAHPQLALQVDANCAYDAQAPQLATFAELDRLGLLMIEQPFGETELLAHAELQRRLVTPVCLDESILDAACASSAIALGACRVVNIKVSRVGGLGMAKAVHDVCRAEGLDAWCGGMHEFGVGRAANVALASLPGFTLPSDVSGSDKYFAEDVVDPPVLAHAGRVSVSRDSPGLGYEPVEDRIEARMVRHQTVEGDRGAER